MVARLEQAIEERANPDILPPKQRFAMPEIDLNYVTELAELGLSQAQIAEGLGIGARTLATWLGEANGRFSEAYKRGKFRGQIGTATVINQAIVKGNVIAAFFKAKQPTNLGWQDVQKQQVSGEIQVTVTRHVIHEARGAITKEIKAEAEDV